LADAIVCQLHSSEDFKIGNYILLKTLKLTSLKLYWWNKNQLCKGSCQKNPEGGGGTYHFRQFFSGPAFRWTQPTSINDFSLVYFISMILNLNTYVQKTWLLFGALYSAYRHFSHGFKILKLSPHPTFRQGGGFLKIKGQKVFSPLPTPDFWGPPLTPSAWKLSEMIDNLSEV
jgi:hypothetical protein